MTWVISLHDISYAHDKILSNPSQNLNLRLGLGKPYKVHPLSLYSTLSLKLAVYSARAGNLSTAKVEQNQIRNRNQTKPEPKPK